LLKLSFGKMKLPINFKDFVSNPIAGILFFALIAIGYLYIDNKTTLTNQIEALQAEVITLKEDYKKLNNKFIETLKTIHE
tara:strand:+ start:518 stop:757 length:240 start_codon:yes stop_codon:yes gene_type:complete